MRTHAEGSGETMLPEQVGLGQIARLDALYRLLTWDSRPAPGATKYMDLEAFKARAVLPTPHRIEGVAEPKWEPDPPRIRNAPPERQPRDHEPRRDHRRGPQPRQQRLAREPRRDDRASTRAVPPTGESKPAKVAPTEFAQAIVRPKPVEKGQTCSGTLLRVDGRWAARFESDDRLAKIVNPAAIPDDHEGANATFYITQQNKRDGISCRFERLESDRG
jgi:hypothetical protein